MLFRLLSAPVPVPGKTRLELEVLDRKFGPLLVFALPEHNRSVIQIISLQIIMNIYNIIHLCI